MPMYEYGCTSCGNKFERMQRFSDPPIETCESCGAPVKKLISATSFVLKGSGWYVTDYARNGQNSKAESKSEPKSETKSESSSSESKSDAAPSCSSAPCGNCPTA